MNKLLYIATLVSGLILITSCENDFENINTNPNSPTEVQPSLLLRQVIYNYGDEMGLESFYAGNLLGQYFAMVDFNLFDRHSLSEAQYGGNPWRILYANLRDNEILLHQAQSNDVNAVYEGPALIMKAYLSAALTDIFGNVPYSEALQGLNGNVTPAYDNQEMIYTSTNGILDNLHKGITAINNYNGAITLEGDILFGGDLQSWVRFANSLKIKHLMRASGQMTVNNDLQAIYDGGNYIMENTQNAAFDFSDGQPNNFGASNIRTGDFNLYVMSETIQDVLDNLNDPRRAVWFRPTANNPAVYQGLINGIDASATSISVGDYSFPGMIFRENSGALDANFITAWETQLFLAEAAEKGLITADAKALYESGVQMAFEYWNTTIPADYLTTGMASFGINNADKIEQILTQKWLANIVNGYEGWIEYRRTGFPAFKSVSASLNDDLIPARMPYPGDEDALNNANYTQAANATNGNSVNAKVWWDVN